MGWKLSFAVWGLFAYAQCSINHAIEILDQSQEYETVVIASDLHNPCGLVIRPGGQKFEEICFSESGAGKVLRLRTDRPDVLDTVVHGFPTSNWALESSVQVGPLGVAFLKRTKLVVGCGGLGAGKDSLRVYDFPADSPLDEPIDYESVDYELGPVPPGTRTSTGEGGYFSLVVNPDIALFASSGGDPQHDWLLKASIAKNKAFDLQPYVATRKLLRGANLLAVTMNLEQSDRGYLVVGSCGEFGTRESDSKIAFLSPHSGRLALALEANLQDIAALAFSPSGQLYAADLAWGASTTGGVYRLDEAIVDGRQTSRPVLIAEVTRPTSLVFTSKNEMVVTALGDEVGNQAVGQLVKITGEF